MKLIYILLGIILIIVGAMLSVNLVVRINTGLLLFDIIISMLIGLIPLIGGFKLIKKSSNIFDSRNSEAVMYFRYIPFAIATIIAIIALYATR